MSINNLNTYLNVRDAHLRVVSGNVYAQAMNIGGINVETAHGLQSVSNTGNATSLTLEFANVTTGFVTTANAQIGRDLVVTGNTTVSTDLTVSANATVTDTLTVSEHLLASKEATVTGNLHVTTIMSDSNVVAEYTGPHDRPLRKYPEVAMTANDNSSTNGYVVDQTNTASHGNADAYAYRLFDFLSTNYQSEAVYSGGNSTSSAQTTTATDGSTHQGVAITLDLATKIRLSYAKITSHTYYGRTPVEGTFLGSNDNSTWDVIGTFSGLSTTVAGQTHRVHIADYATKSAYRYIRLVVTRIHTSAVYLGGTILEFRELEYYGYEEGSGSLDTTLKSVYNVPATTGTQLEVYYDGQDYTQASDFTGAGGVVDKAGGDQDGTAGTGVTFDSTYKAFTFDGTANGKITGTHNFGADTSPVLTMSFWMKRTAVVGTGWNYVATIGTSTSGQMIGLTINPSSQFNFSNYSDGTLSAEAILLNQWYHVTLVANGEAALNSTNFKMYINGKEPKLSSHGGGSTTTLTGTQLTLGTNTNSGEAFNGSIANFRLYSKALNADQVKELYDYQKDYFLGSKSQVTLYKGHLGVGVTEPSGQLELAGDERLQEYPPGPMDDYETLIPGHGVFCVSASSLWSSSSTYAAYNIFDKTFNTFWASAGNGSSVDTYNATTGLADTALTPDIFQGVKGSWMKLKLPYTIKPLKVQITPRATTETSPPPRQPKSGIVWGSKDDVYWEQISSFNFSTAADEYFVDVNIDEYYSSLVLQVTAIRTDLTGDVDALAIRELRYFGTPGPTTLDKGSLSLTRSLDVPRISRYDVDTETPRPEKLVVDFDTTVNSSPTDISGQGNHGTFSNASGAPTYSAADKAFDFDGVNGVIYSGPLSPAMTGDKICSMSAWFKTTNASASNQSIMWLGHYNISNLLFVGVNSGTLRIGIGSGCSLDVASVIESDKWYHVVGIKQGTGSITSSNFSSIFKLYLNGEPMTGTFGGTARTLNVTTNYWYVGAGNASGNEAFPGYISNPKLYDTILEPSEVRKLYNLGRTGRSMVISDTAVGIGKVPEAQLDVRGNLNVDGVITNQQRPAFYVWRDDTTNYTAEINTTGVITNWDSKRVDTAGTFDLSNGRYYIPVSGLYNFVGAGLYRYRGSGNGILEVSFYVNGSNVNVRGISYNRGNTTSEHHTVTITFLRFMNAGDYVQMGLHDCQTACDLYYGDGLGYFSGYLLG